MSSRKKPHEERAIIVGQSKKRPYGVQIRIYLQTSGAFGDVEDACVGLHTGAFLTIKPTRTAPWEGGKNLVLTLEGFPTAASAEFAGRRLVQALLWTAVSTDAPLKLEYAGYERASVFDRNQPAGIACSAYGQIKVSPTVVFNELHEAYALLEDPDERLLLSLEVFCAARLESSPRAVFLAIVSSLEPLACESPLGDDVHKFVSECLARLKSSDAIPKHVRDSLEGRLQQLRRESIRQAILRLARDNFPDDPEAVRTIDAAYSLRSEIIHNGAPRDLDVDLEHEARVLSQIIRRMYANILGHTLKRSGNSVSRS